MAKQIIRCSTCGYVVGRDSWVTPPVTISDEEVEGLYWCKRCQKEFTLRITGKLDGRSITSDGYVLIKVPGRGWIREHLYIWEKHNGIPLPAGFVIHHINGVKDDNRIENLIALPKRSHNPHLVKSAVSQP